jgi:hypothetical protein
LAGAYSLTSVVPLHWPLVLEVEEVAGLVGGGLGGVLRVAVGEVLGEDEGDVGGGVGEAADVGDAAGLGAEPWRPVPPKTTLAPTLLARVLGLTVVTSMLNGLYFSLTRVQISRMLASFGIAEGGGVAIGVVGGGVCRGRTGPRWWSVSPSKSR